MLDAEALERHEHRPVKEGAVGLHCHVHLSRHPGTQGRTRSASQSAPSQQRLTAMQDDVDAGQTCFSACSRDALDGLGSDGLAHAPGHVPPGLIRHFIDIAV